MPKLEDLKVLRRSPDLLNNVKCAYVRLTCADPGFFSGGGGGGGGGGGVQARSRSTTAYNRTNFVLPYMGVADILVK